jgi:CheY-like chemotaxis protein
MMIKKIMFIDNCEIDNFVSETLVRRSGFVDEIVSFQSASEGLQYLSDVLDQPDQSPNVIVLDLGMHIMDGFGFLDEFMKFPAELSQGSKVVVLTSSLDLEDRRRAKSYLCVMEVLEKPLRLDQLRAVFVTYLAAA